MHNLVGPENAKRSSLMLKEAEGKSSFRRNPFCSLSIFPHWWLECDLAPGRSECFRPILWARCDDSGHHIVCDVSIRKYNDIDTRNFQHWYMAQASFVSASLAPAKRAVIFLIYEGTYVNKSSIMEKPTANKPTAISRAKSGDPCFGFN